MYSAFSQPSEIQVFIQKTKNDFKSIENTRVKSNSDVSKSSIVRKNKTVFKIKKRTESYRVVYNLIIENKIDEDLLLNKTEYLKRMNSYFSKFKNHPLIDYLYNTYTLTYGLLTADPMLNTIAKFEFYNAPIKELPWFRVSKNEFDLLQPLFLDFTKNQTLNHSYPISIDTIKKLFIKLKTKLKTRYFLTIN